jgi:hypothetical protein
MIYHDNLEDLILDRHIHNSADEIIILSGYTGPSPISKLSTLPIKSTVINGIKAGVSRDLSIYQSITKSSQSDIWIKNNYNHSKIYCWLRHKKPIEILSGSANFSTAGLNSAFKGETLFDVDRSDWNYAYAYLKDALLDSTISTSFTPNITQARQPSTSTIANKLDKVLSLNPPKAEIYVGGRGRKMQPKSGWNWGHGKGNNAPNVAEQRIRKELITEIPNLFPNNGVNVNYQMGQALKNTKPNAEILFDDGFVMDATFEQGGPKNAYGQKLYKAFCSYPDKATYGKYIRRRLNLSSTALITDADIKNRGKDTITLELLSPGVYFCDFS